MGAESGRAAMPTGAGGQHSVVSLVIGPYSVQLCNCHDRSLTPPSMREDGVHGAQSFDLSNAGGGDAVGNIVSWWWLCYQTQKRSLSDPNSIGASESSDAKILQRPRLRLSSNAFLTTANPVGKVQ